jgi:SAM-dependent methyltransferase
VVDIGCGSGEKLAALHPEFELIGVDFGSNLVECKRRYPFGRWIEWDLEAPEIIPLSPDVLSSCIVVCSDVIEHLLDPSHLLKNLKVFLDHAAAAILTTPERDLVRGLGDIGPPSNLAHVREWNLQELELLLKLKGLHVGYSGLTFNNDRDLEKTTTLVILENNQRSTKSVAPDHWQAKSLSLLRLSLQMRQLFRRVTRPR